MSVSVPPLSSPFVRGGSAALAAAALTAAFALVPTGSASAAGSGLNPMAVNGNFTIMTTGDATLANAELEGSAAIGGNVQFKESYPLVHSTGLTPRDYDLATIDGDPTRLLVGGTFIPVWNNPNDISSAGSIRANQDGFTKIGTMAGLTVVADGSGSKVKGTAATPTQSLFNKNQPDITTVAAPGAFASYVSQRAVTASAATSCLQDVTPTETATVHVVSVVATPQGSAADLDIDLQAGKTNIIELPATHAFFSSQKMLNLTGAPLDASTALIIRPTGLTTGQTLDMPEFKAASSTSATSPNLFAPYTLIDLSALTAGTDVTVTGKKVTGSIYAPGADLTLTQGSPAEGSIYAATLNARGNGEIHHYGFASVVTCASAPSATATTTTTAATTSPAAPTTSATSSATVSASTTASVSTSASASAGASSTAGLGNAGDERTTTTAGGEIASTGSTVKARFLGLAAVLLAAGAALILAARRRAS